MKRLLALGLTLILVLGMVSFASAEEEIVIEVLNWNGGSEQTRNLEACEQYMAEHPGIKIDFQVVTDNYMAKLNTLVAAGETPDIYYIAETSAVQWGLNGMALDLAPLYAEQGINMKDYFIESAMFGSGDQVFGLAYGVVDIVLYYNKDLFDAAGIPYPSRDPANPMTWEEYVDVAKKLTVDTSGKHPGEDGFQWQ